MQQDYTQEFKGIKVFRSETIDDIRYGIWIFEDGKFENKGNAGYFSFLIER